MSDTQEQYPQQQDTQGQDTRPPRRVLRRPARGRMVAGVAAGLAEHFGIDVALIRLGFAVLTIVGFTGLPFLGGVPLYLAGIPLYLAGWLLIPEEGSDQSIVGRLLGHHEPSA